MDKQDLDELKHSLWDRVRQAIVKGDREQALSLLEKMQQNTHVIITALSDTVDLLLTTLADKAGEEEVYEVQKDNCLRVLIPNPAMVGFSEMDAKDRLKGRVSQLTDIHGVPVEVEEDNEKYVIHASCNTGGGLVERGSLGKTRRPYYWSGSQEGIGYYCAHCIIGFELLWAQEYRYPLWITLPPRTAGDKCTHLIYKDPKNIPEKYYKRLGLEKYDN